MNTCNNDEQFKNVYFSIEVIEEGMFTSDNEVQLEKHPSPIEVTEEGIEKYSRDEHFENALSPIFTSEDCLSIKTTLKDVHSKKASVPISIIDFGIVTCVIDKQ